MLNTHGIGGGGTIPQAHRWKPVESASEGRSIIAKGSEGDFCHFFAFLMQGLSPWFASTKSLPCFHLVLGRLPLSTSIEKIREFSAQNGGNVPFFN